MPAGRRRCSVARGRGGGAPAGEGGWLGALPRSVGLWMVSGRLSVVAARLDSGGPEAVVDLGVGGRPGLPAHGWAGAAARIGLRRSDSQSESWPSPEPANRSNLAGTARRQCPSAARGWWHLAEAAACGRAGPPTRPLANRWASPERQPARIVEPRRCGCPRFGWTRLTRRLWMVRRSPGRFVGVPRYAGSRGPEAEVDLARRPSATIRAPNHPRDGESRGAWSLAGRRA